MGKKQLRKKYDISEQELNQYFSEAHKLGLDIEDYIKSKKQKDKDKKKEVLLKYNYHNNFVSYDDATTKQFLIDFVLESGWTITQINHNEEKDHTQFSKIIDDFLSVEKSLNSQLFWIIFGYVYLDLDFSNKSQKQKLMNAITKERMSISLEDRSKLGCLIYLLMSHTCLALTKNMEELTRSDLITGISHITDKNYDADSVGKTKARESSGWKMVRIISKRLTQKNKRGQKTIKLYRGFSFNTKSSERVIDKNKTYNNQIVGEGISYTFHKDVAVNFSLRNQMFGIMVRNILQLQEAKGDKLYNKYQTLDVNTFLNNKTLRDNMIEENRFIQFIKQSSKRNLFRKKELQDTFGEYQYERTGYVGTYEIKINDILFVSNRGYEMECVSNNYKLLNYQVVDMKTISKWWKSWGRRILGNDFYN